MVLVDSSVWINHFRSANLKLSDLLDQELVLEHPFVIGELACGNLADWTEIVSLLHALPSAPRADDDEILFFVEKHRMMGKGLVLIDVHLLASSKLAGCRLWTDDRRLRGAARTLKIETGQPKSSANRSVADTGGLLRTHRGCNTLNRRSQRAQRGCQNNDLLSAFFAIFCSTNSHGGGYRVV